MNAYQTTYVNPSQAAFITKFSVNGSTLAYSTYLSGTGFYNGAHAIAVDGTGSAYVVGSTSSTDFPTVSAYQTTFGGGSYDGYVAKLSASGSALTYSTYLGGSGIDYCYGIAVDGSGNAHVVGYTGSTNFPLASAYQSVLNAGPYDAFATKLSAAGSAITYSTFLGGSGNETGLTIAVDKAGAAYVAGGTASSNFPTVSAYQTTNAGGGDGFVAKISDPELAPGVACTQSGECADGLFCVDGVCCDTSCTDQCAACDVSGHLGTCTPVTGSPHGARSVCATNGPCAATCDGSNSKTCTYPPTVCASTCANASETDSLCDTVGNCAGQITHSCNNLVCADAKTCKPACATNADCSAGFACAPDNTCQTSNVCVGDHSSKQPTAP